MEQAMESSKIKVAMAAVCVAVAMSAAEAATVKVSQGKADATGTFSVDGGEACLVWDIRLLERHGIENLVLADGTRVNLVCGARSAADEKPVLAMSASRPVKVKVFYGAAASPLQLVVDAEMRL